MQVKTEMRVEKNTAAIECFEFNRPYRTIDLRFGYSTQVLPSLEWIKKTIAWLDYDGKLNTDVLADVDTFCAKAASGSVLAISVNAQHEMEPPPDVRRHIEEETGETFDLDKYRLNRLKELIGDKAPSGTVGSMLRGNGVARVFRRTVLNEIESVLTTRNALLPDPEKLVFQQLFNFEYIDGARIVTVGGVVVRQADSSLFDACAFEKLDFVRAGSDPYFISVPCLTAKEVRHLNAQLPCEDLGKLTAPGVPDGALRTYGEIYRYFPAFSEILFS